MDRARFNVIVRIAQRNIDTKRSEAARLLTAAKSNYLGSTQARALLAAAELRGYEAAVNDLLVGLVGSALDAE